MGLLRYEKSMLICDLVSILLGFWKVLARLLNRVVRYGFMPALFFGPPIRTAPNQNSRGMNLSNPFGKQDIDPNLSIFLFVSFEVFLSL